MRRSTPTEWTGNAWERPLSSGGRVEHAFGPGNFEEIEPGVLECAGVRSKKESPVEWEAVYHIGPDRIDFELTVVNPNPTPLSDVGAEVCVKFGAGEWWSDGACFLMTREGMRSVAELGRDAGMPNDFQAWLIEGESYDNPFMREFWGFGHERVSLPLWVSICEPAGCSVVVGCESAYFIHSNPGNPCTDLGMRYGDLAGGEKATCSGFVEFAPRDPAEIFAAYGGRE